MRMIDGDALEERIKVEGRNQAEQRANRYDNVVLAYGDCFGMVRDAPTINAATVVRGEWIDSPTGDYAICSHCHVEWNVFDNDTYRFRHCPACGAKMEGKP